MSRKHGRDIAASDSQLPQLQQEDTGADAFTLLGRTVIDSLFLSFISSSVSLRAQDLPVEVAPPHVTSLARCSVLLKVRKEWPGQGVFTGCVARYKHDLFLVRYEDEDEEEMTRDELLEYLVTEEAGQPVEGTQQEEQEQEEREPDLSTSPPAAKRRRKAPEPKPPKPCPLDLSEVPMNLPPIPSDRPGSASRFKGVSKDKSGKKWQAEIQIASEGGKVYLGIFDSEEEAGIIYARARCKFPVSRFP